MRVVAIFALFFAFIPYQAWAVDAAPKTTEKLEKLFPNEIAEKPIEKVEIKPAKVKEYAAPPTIFYSKDTIKIHRKNPPKPASEAMPWQVPDEAINLNVELRDSSILYQQNGWFNFSDYSEKSGVLILFSDPSTPPIQHLEQYAPVDILLIDKQGKITQIAPSINLSALEEDITPTSPILAFLFMKGGASKELSIGVGDEVEYSAFKKPPLILSAPREDEKK